MALFAYKVRDKYGKLFTGQLEGASKNHVLAQLRDFDYFIIDVKPASAVGMSMSVDSLGISLNFLKTKVKLQDLALFNRQLYIMIAAGIPLLSGLNLLKEQTKPKTPLYVSLEQLIEEISKGRPLSQAMAKQSNVYPPMMVNMVEAGEVGGILDEVMDRLADHFEKEHETKEKVKTAMIYPATISVVAMIAIFILFTFVLPMFAEILDNLGVELPLPTKIALGISYMFRTFWYVLIGLILGLMLFANKFSKTNEGRLLIDKYLLKMPLFGDAVKKVIISRFSRTLATLLESGVPIIKALEVVAKTIDNQIIRNSVDEAQERIKEGQSIAPPLKQSGIFPPMVIQMIAIGEESGSIDAMLNKVSVYYDREVSQLSERIAKIIEPILLLVLGGIVAFVLASIMIPMFSVFSNIQ